MDRDTLREDMRYGFGRREIPGNTTAQQVARISRCTTGKHEMGHTVFTGTDECCKWVDLGRHP